jgi:hypothetical protein
MQVEPAVGAAFIACNHIAASASTAAGTVKVGKRSEKTLKHQGAGTRE